MLRQQIRPGTKTANLNLLVRVLVAALFWMTLPGESLGQAMPKRLAVLEFHSGDPKLGLSPQEVQFFAEHVRGFARDYLPVSGWTVVTRESMEALKRPDVDLANCESECIFGMAEMLQADYVVTGKIGRFLGKYQIIVQLYETREKNLLGDARPTASTLNGLAEPFEMQVRRLFLTRLPGASGTSGAAALSGAVIPETRHVDAPAGEVSVPGQRMFIVEVHSDPPGAVVTMDGSLFCQSAPCSRPAPAGPRLFRLQQDQYLDTTVRINVARNAQIETIRMRPNFSTLTLRTSPSGLTVRVNGRDFGKTPVVAARVDAGRAVVEFSSPCHLGIRREITLKRGEEREIQETLKSREAFLSLRAIDAATGNDIVARVWSGGGRPLGETPFQEKVNICLQEALLVAAGYDDKRERISLAEGKTTERQVYLNRAVAPTVTYGSPPVIGYAVESRSSYPFIGLGLGVAAATGSMHEIYKTVAPGVEFDLLLGVGMGRTAGVDLYARTGVAFTAAPDETDEAEDYQKWIDAGEPEWLNIPLLGGFGLFFGNREKGVSVSLYGEAGLNFTHDDFRHPDGFSRVDKWSTTFGWGTGVNLMVHAEYTFAIYGGIRVLDAAYSADTRMGDFGLRFYGMGI